ncbi:MAG: hypothetical protein ACRC6X_03830 [Culicoidibacterales bacterium]
MLQISIDPINIIWMLLGGLIIVGIILLVQVLRFVKQLMEAAREAQAAIVRAQELIEQTNKMIIQTTEITERVNNSYKQVNTMLDYATTGVTNFVLSKIDKK